MTDRRSGFWRAGILAVIVGVAGLAQADRPAPDLAWLSAQMADASGRAYEPTAIWLIDHARDSIVLAMYLLREHDDA